MAKHVFHNSEWLKEFLKEIWYLSFFLSFFGVWFRRRGCYGIWDLYTVMVILKNFV